MSIRISCSLILLLVAVGCGGGGSSRSDAPVRTESPPQPADTMALQVFSLAQDTMLTPLVAYWPQDDATEVISESLEEADGPAATMVYRVQLYTTKDLAQATAVQREAEVDFGEPARETGCLQRLKKDLNQNYTKGLLSFTQIILSFILIGLWLPLHCLK